MAYQSPYAGYPATVWATCYQALAWFNDLLANSIQANTVANEANLVFQLMRNASVAIDTWQTGAALSREVELLANVRSLALSLDPATQVYFDARIDAVTIAAFGVSALSPVFNPFTVVPALQNGVNDLLNPGYLEWCLGFQGEIPPAEMTGDTLPAFAADAAAAWLAVTNAVSVLQGDNPTSAYDTAARMYRCSIVVSNMIAQMGSLPFAANDPSIMWNNIVALPTILLDASTTATSPSTLSAQQAMSIRFVLNKMAVALALFLRALKTSVGTASTTAILSNTDSLMDQAARETGNFETWTEIARLNNIQPPYPGPTNQAVALTGRQLYMPGSDVSLGANQSPPTYPDSIMGVDYYLGPINGPQPAWNGDLPLIRGLLNFSQALGRRLQTPLGALVYHPDYGSRIPGEVGAIQSVDEAARLAAFGKAALAGDPRTGRVISAIATVNPGLLATFAGVVTPVGPGTTPVSLFVNIPPG